MISRPPSDDQKLWDFHELQNRKHFRWAAPRLRFIAQEINRFVSSGRLLDIGFGDGQLFREIHRREKKVRLYGVDISSANVAATAQALTAEGIMTELLTASIDKLPYADNFFDIVVAVELIEHLDDETLTNGLKEISRVLKKNGLLLLTTPANEHLEDSLCYCPRCGASFHRWGHRQGFSKKRLKELIEKIFSNPKIRPVAFCGQERPDRNPAAIIKYFVKLVTFHTTKYILGADYHWYVQARK